MQRLERTCCLRLGPVALCCLPIEGSDLGLRSSPEYKYTRVHAVSVVTPCSVIGGCQYPGVSCCLHVCVTSSKQKFEMPRCLVQGPLSRVLDSLRFCVIGLDLVNSVYIRKEVDWTTKMKARAEESDEMTLQNTNCVHFTYLSSE